MSSSKPWTTVMTRNVGDGAYGSQVGRNSGSAARARRVTQVNGAGVVKRTKTRVREHRGKYGAAHEQQHTAGRRR